MDDCVETCSSSWTLGRLVFTRSGKVIILSVPGLRIAMRLCLPSCAKLGAVGVWLSWKDACSGVRIGKAENAGDIVVNAAWAGDLTGDAWLFLRQLKPLLLDHGYTALLDLGVVTMAENVACL